MRLEEAKLLRETIDARLAANPEANLVVLGDFNDTKDSASTKAVIGRGKLKLVDTRPAERNGDNASGPNPPGSRATSPGPIITAKRTPTRALITSSSAPAWRENGSPTKPMS